MENYNFPPNLFASLNPTYTPSNSQATTNHAANEVDNSYLEHILDLEDLANPNLTAASRGSTNSKGQQQQFHDGSQTSDAISTLRKYRRKSRDQNLQSSQAQPHAQLSGAYYSQTANNICESPYNLRSRTKSRTLSGNYPLRNQVNSSNHLQGGGIINVQNDQQMMPMFSSFTGTGGNYCQRPAQHSPYDTREGIYSQYPQVPKKRRRVDTESSSLTESNTRSQAQPLDLRTNEFSSPNLAQNLQSGLHHSLLGSSLGDLESRQSHTQEEILAGKTLLSLNRTSQCSTDSRYPPTYTRAGQQVNSYPNIDQYYSNINNAGIYNTDFTQQIRYNLQQNLNTDPSQNTLPGYFTGYQTPSYNYMTSVTPNPPSEYSTNYRVNTDWQAQQFQRSDQFRSPTNSMYQTNSAHHQPPPPYSMPCPPHWYGGQYSYNNYTTQNMGDSSNTGQQLNSCSQRNLPFNSSLLNPTRGMSNILPSMPSTSVLSTPVPSTPTLSSIPVATPGRATRGRTPNSRRTTALQIAPQSAASATAGEGSRKRTRTTYNSGQLKILEAEFTVQQYCTQEIKNRLSKQLNMTPNQVKVWFQNRRTREKKNNPKFSSKSRGSRRGRKVTCDKSQAENEESDGSRMQLRPRRAPSVIIDTPPDPMPDLQVQTPESPATNHYRFPFSNFTNGGSYKVNYVPSMPVLTKYSPTASSRVGANPILSGLIARNQQPTVRCGDDHKSYQDSQKQPSTSPQNSVLPTKPIKLGDIPQNSPSLRKQISANEQLLNSLNSRSLGSNRINNNFSQNFYNSSQSNEVVRTMLNSFSTENNKVNFNGTTLDQNGSCRKDQFRMFERYANSSPQTSKSNLNQSDPKSDASYGYQQDASPPRFPVSPEVEILEDIRNARNERKNITEIVSNQQRGFVYQIKDEPPSEDLNSNYNTDVSSAENQNGSTSGEDQTDALKNMEEMVNKCPSGGPKEPTGTESTIPNHISKSLSNSFTSGTYENISSPEVQIALNNYQSNLNTLNQPLSVSQLFPLNIDVLNSPYGINTFVPKSEVTPETSPPQINPINLNSNLISMPGFSFTNPLTITNGDSYKQPVSATSSSFEGSSCTPPRTIKENNSPEVINGSENEDQKLETINGYTTESINKNNPFSFNLERGKPIDVPKIQIPAIDIKTEVEEVDDENRMTYAFTSSGHSILDSNPLFPSYTFNSSNKVEPGTTSDSEPSPLDSVFNGRKVCESIYNTARSLNSPTKVESIITSNSGQSFTNSSIANTSASNDVTSNQTSDSRIFSASNSLFNTPTSRNLSNNIESIIPSNTGPLLHNSTNNPNYRNSVFNTTATRNSSNNAESTSNSTVALPVGYDHLFTTDGALLTVRNSSTDNGSSNNRRS